jgi:hypothetical protein
MRARVTLSLELSRRSRAVPFGRQAAPIPLLRDGPGCKPAVPSAPPRPFEFPWGRGPGPRRWFQSTPGEITIFLLSFDHTGSAVTGLAPGEPVTPDDSDQNDIQIRGRRHYRQRHVGAGSDGPQGDSNDIFLSGDRQQARDDRDRCFPLLHQRARPAFWPIGDQCRSAASFQYVGRKR